MSRNPLRGCWDYPQEHTSGQFGTPIARDGRLTLVGWALADEQPAIEVTIDGRHVESLAPTCYREDIEIIFGHAYPLASAMTGWATTVDVATVGNGSHIVGVEVRAAGESLQLGRRTLRFDVPRERPEESLKRLQPLLRSQPCHESGHQALFSSRPGEWIRHATSVWGFSGQAREMARDGGTLLVVGAGIAPTVDNMYQLDIFDYPNVDVVSHAPELPFKDESFDGVICENVIEHVPDPFALVGEIERVLKPEGRLGINGTNLHFTHGFPSHFFNATEFGMRYLLEDRSGFEGRYEFTDIRHSLRTILTYYFNALRPDARARLERVRLGDLLETLSGRGDRDVERLIGSLSDKAQKALSTNIYFVGRKRPRIS